VFEMWPNPTLKFAPSGRWDAPSALLCLAFTGHYLRRVVDGVRATA